MMKLKHLVAAVGLSSLLSLSANALDVTQQFLDVEHSWYTPYVQVAVDSGYASGKTTNTFDPMGEITAAEFTVMLCNAFHGKELLVQENLLTGENGWAELWLNTMKSSTTNEASQEILASISPYNSLSRYDAAHMVAILLDNKEAPMAYDDKLSGLTDVADAPYANYLQRTLSVAVMSGKTESTFVGEGCLTRAEACVIMTNLLEKIMEESYKTQTAMQEGTTLSAEETLLEIVRHIATVGQIMTEGAESLKNVSSSVEYVAILQDMSKGIRSLWNMAIPQEAVPVYEQICSYQAALANSFDTEAYMVESFDDSVYSKYGSLTEALAGEFGEEYLNTVEEYAQISKEYGDFISVFLDALATGEDTTQSEPEKPNELSIYSDVMEHYMWGFSLGWGLGEFENAGLNYLAGYSNLENIGCAFYDVDEDGTMELFVGDIGSGGLFWDLYTIKDNSAVLVARNAERSSYTFCSDGLFYYTNSSGADNSESGIYHLLDGNLVEATFVPLNEWEFNPSKLPYEPFTNYFS